jgi:hypothetical protein
MKKQGLIVWTAANALGMGVGFAAGLHMLKLIEFGLDFERYWEAVPSQQSVRVYIARFVATLLMGVILGAVQALILRSWLLRVVPWILATIAGFGLLAIMLVPLQVVDIWGNIPGPVEPIILIVGSCSLAGIFQYMVLRKQGMVASKWLVLWVGGLVVSLVPTALLFMSIEGVGLVLNWPMELFVTGFSIAGVAALVSGGALFAAISAEE